MAPSSMRWWRRSLYLLVFSCVYAIGVGGYEIPSAREVVNKAMFVYDDGYNNYYRSPISAATDHIGLTEQLIFPFMNFTCHGMITRLIFVARRSWHEPPNDYDSQNSASWPMFSLWHRVDGNFTKVQSLGPLNPAQITSTQPVSRPITDDRQTEEVFRINFTPPIPFEPNYILGLRQNSTASSHPDWFIKVLRQRGGYGLTLSCDQQEPQRCLEVGVTERQEMPYIAIEISQQCAMGFLDQESLRMIVDAPRNMYDFTSIHFVPSFSMHMPAAVNQFGPLKKIIIAARFDVSAPVGWPEMQITRIQNDGTSYIAFTTNTIEPKPTGYLNLYEYNLEYERLNITSGDRLNIVWHGDSHQTRFSLAYYNGAYPDTPMVSFVVGDCESETDIPNYEDELPSSGITGTQAGTVIEENNSTKLLASTSTNQIESNTKLIMVNVSVVISVVIVFSLSLIIVVVVILIAFVHQKKHRSSTEGSEVQPTRPDLGEIIEVDVNEAYITQCHTILTEPNVAYSTPVVHSTVPHDYDYVGL